MAQVWAFVVLLPGLATLSTSANRYLLFFTMGYAVVRLTTTIGLGLALWGAYQLLRKLPATWCSSLLVAAGLCVVAVVGWHLLWVEYLLSSWDRYVAAVVVGLLAEDAVSVYMCWGVTRWARWFGRASVFISLLLPIYWLNVLTAHRYEAARAPILERVAEISAPAEMEAPTNNLYILVLDAWSYRLTFDGENVRMGLPALRQASRQMTGFHDAHAPGVNTMQSLPRLLYERPEMFTLENG